MLRYSRQGLTLNKHQTFYIFPFEIHIKQKGFEDLRIKKLLHLSSSIRAEWAKGN